MTAPAVPLFDGANGLLSQAPAQMVTGLVQTAQGQRMALTIRTPSATLTVFLERADATVWGDNIRATAAQMSGLIVPPSAVAAHLSAVGHDSAAV